MQAADLKIYRKLQAHEGEARLTPKPGPWPCLTEPASAPSLTRRPREPDEPDEAGNAAHHASIGPSTAVVPAPNSAPTQDQPSAAPERDESLMARLYREHNQALIRFLMTRVDSEEEAMDVAQEAYVRMLQLDSHGAVSFLSSYLFRTAANLAIDRVRHRIVRRRADGELARQQELGEPPDRALQVQQQLEIIDRHVQELPPKCRQAFYLHRLHDLSPPEIAAQLGVTTRMVHNYVVRALEHLSARLEGDEP